MQSVDIYAIFWLPASGQLQNGNPTVLPTDYQTDIKRFLTDWHTHGIANITTQYFQTVGSTTNYVQDAGSLAGSALDTSPYPASMCDDSDTPGNCITDAQIQQEIKNVMMAQGWTGGNNKIFLLFTSQGEGSCDMPGSCAYTQFCGYHSVINGSPNIIYGNEPFASEPFADGCVDPSTPSPNNNPAADKAISTASHELSEATTDPFIDGWFTTDGKEIGDLCGAAELGTKESHGTNTWDNVAGVFLANQSWNGDFYEVQEEFDNHTLTCKQVGPD
jgi:hypothetical protein